MLNQVQLIGRVGRDLELRFTKGGTAVATTGFATTRVFKNAAGERREDVEWHQIVFWGRTAAAACQVLAKGRLVFVQGRLRTRTWEVEDGKRYRTEVVVDTWQVLDARRTEAEAEAEPEDGGGFLPDAAEAAFGQELAEVAA